MTRVYVKDLRPAGVCPQVRQVFFEKNGLDWRDFVRNGIDADDLRATGDMTDTVERVISFAQKRENKDGV